MNSSERVNELKLSSAAYSGTAGPAMVARFIDEVRQSPEEVLTELRGQFELCVRELTPDGASPEQGRVIRRFGLVKTAGLMAANLGVLPYSEEEIRHCIEYVRDLYLNYTPPVTDSCRGLIRLQEFLIKNHTALPSVRDTQAKVSNAKGFKGASGQYLLTDEQLAAAAGVGTSGTMELAKTLKEKGFLTIQEPSRLRCKHKVASAGGQFLRFFTIKPTFLEADLTGEDSGSTGDAGSEEGSAIVELGTDTPPRKKFAMSKLSIKRKADSAQSINEADEIPIQGEKRKLFTPWAKAASPATVDEPEREEALTLADEDDI